MRRLRPFSRNEDGAATVEFVLVFSFLMVIILSLFETGWLMTRQMMLDRGVDMAVRDLKLGDSSAMNYDGLKQKVCQYANILEDCSNAMILEVVEFDATSAYPQNNANCVDRTNPIAPVMTPIENGRGVLVFVRACVIIDPMFPGTGVGLQMVKDGVEKGFQMTSYTAFISEP